MPTAWIQTLPIIGPTLSRNLGTNHALGTRANPAAIGILTLIRSVWSTELGLMHRKQ
jgi:hypothetical protein